MKTIIAGTRSATVQNVTSAIKKCPFVDMITEVVSGKNKVEIRGSDGEIIRITGADYWGEQWAEFVAKVPVAEFPANWAIHGGKAGPIRNAEMAEYADALILVWDGKSRESADMLKKARAKGLRVFVWDYMKGVTA